MSLLYAKSDFGRAIGIATMAGMDTDCNAATAGSIMGIAAGAQGIPPHWKAPLNDALQSQLAGLQTVKISEIAHRTYEIARRNCRRAG